MKIACLFADRAFDKMGQDMLFDGMFAGLVNAFGSTNVRHFPDGHPQFLGHEDYLQEWPFWLGAGCLRGKPLATFPLDEADAILVNVRWILNAVEDGIDLDVYNDLSDCIDPNKVILIDSSDTPSYQRLLTCKAILGGHIPLFAHRPGIVNDSPLTHGDVQWALGRRLATVHISVPYQHVMRMMAKWLPDPYEVVLDRNVTCALNDNGVYRRAIVEAISDQFTQSRIMWGSASKYFIDGTMPLLSPPAYYHQIQNSRVVVAARGAGVDCLRETEICCLGSLLVTQDPGWGYGLFTGVHCLMYETPETCVAQCHWAIDNPGKAREIAREGQRLYFEQASPERQVYRLLEKAGLLCH